MAKDKQTLDFLKLFMRHEQEIFAYILTLVPHLHDADDLFQEGMAVMWQKFDQFEPGTNFAAWGVQIMRFKILDYRRKMARDKHVLLDDALFEVLIEHLPSIQNDMTERIEALRKCQTRLDNRSKNILKMRYEQNTPVEKIASYLNLSRRHLYHVLGQINNTLLRCMRRTLVQGRQSYE